MFTPEAATTSTTGRRLEVHGPDPVPAMPVEPAQPDRLANFRMLGSSADLKDVPGAISPVTEYQPSMIPEKDTKPDMPDVAGPVGVPTQTENPNSVSFTTSRPPVAETAPAVDVPPTVPPTPDQVATATAPEAPESKSLEAPEASGPVTVEQVQQNPDLLKARIRLLEARVQRLESSSISGRAKQAIGAIKNWTQGKWDDMQDYVQNHPLVKEAVDIVNKVDRSMKALDSIWNTRESLEQGLAKGDINELLAETPQAQVAAETLAATPETNTTEAKSVEAATEAASETNPEMTEAKTETGPVNEQAERVEKTLENPEGFEEHLKASEQLLELGSFLRKGGLSNKAMEMALTKEYGAENASELVSFYEELQEMQEAQDLPEEVVAQIMAEKIAAIQGEAEDGDVQELAAEAGVETGSLTRTEVQRRSDRERKKVEKREAMELSSESKIEYMSPGEYVRVVRDERLRLIDLKKKGKSLDSDSPTYREEHPLSAYYNYSGDLEAPEALQTAIATRDNEIAIASALAHAQGIEGGEQLDVFETDVRETFGDRITINRTGTDGKKITVFEPGTRLIITQGPDGVKVSFREPTTSDKERAADTAGRVEASFSFTKS